MGDGDFKFEEMTLQNVGQGALAERFQECLMEALEIFEQPGAWEETKGRLKVKITASVEISFDIESRTRIVDVGCDLRRPKRRFVRDAAYVQDGVFVVQPDLKQHNLYPLPNPGQSGKKEG